MDSGLPRDEGPQQIDMPDVTIPGILILTLTALAGLVLGWLARGRRAADEKSALSSGWKERIEARHKEQRRLVEQNRSLLEQVSELKASQAEATDRTRALSVVVKEACQRRNELQRQIRDIRNNLEAALAERRRLQSNMQKFPDRVTNPSAALKEKDEKIFRLSREVESWQARLPPLLQRFQDRDDDAKRLESALDHAHERILELEAGSAGHTHVESVSCGALTPEMHASNDALGQGSGLYTTLATFERRVSIEATDRLNGSGIHGETDDLQAIKGVGPAIEKTLHDLGIFRFSQIAEMSEYDIHRVAERLKGFRSRIYREDWIGQARELHHRRGRRTH